MGHVEQLADVIRRYVNTQTQSGVLDAKLGNGNGQIIANVPGAHPHSVWVRLYSSAVNGTELSTAYLHTSKIPYVNDSTLDGYPIKIGKLPAAFGVPGYAVLDVSGLAGGVASSNGTPTDQYILAGLNSNNLSVATTDGATTLNGITQILVPPGTLTSSGSGNATLAFGSGGGSSTTSNSGNNGLTTSNSANFTIAATSTNSDVALGSVTSVFGTATSAMVVTSPWAFVAPISATYTVQLQLFTSASWTSSTFPASLSTPSRTYTLAFGNTSLGSGFYEWNYTIPVYAAAGETIKLSIQNTTATALTVYSAASEFSWSNYRYSNIASTTVTAAANVFPTSALVYYQPANDVLSRVIFSPGAAFTGCKFTLGYTGATSAAYAGTVLDFRDGSQIVDFPNWLNATGYPQQIYLYASGTCSVATPSLTVLCEFG